MKVLMINGSPRPNGNTSLALQEMETIFKAEGIETEIVQVGNKAIRGCIACGKCAEKGRCVFNDAVNEALEAWMKDPENFYLIGSAVGPQPYPEMVARFQSVISEEIKKQLKERTGKENPDYVVACLGGGSNAAGAFYHFIN